MPKLTPRTRYLALGIITLVVVILLLLFWEGRPGAGGINNLRYHFGARGTATVLARAEFIGTQKGSDAELQFLSKMLKKHPSAELFARKAQVELVAGQFDIAGIDASNALNLAPASMEYRRLRIDILSQANATMSGEPYSETQLGDFRSIQSAGRADLHDLTGIMRIHANAGRFDSAYVYARRILSGYRPGTSAAGSTHDFAWAFFTAAACYDQKGSWKDAQAAYQQACGLISGNDALLFHDVFASLLMKHGQLVPAQNMLQQGLTRMPAERRNTYDYLSTCYSLAVLALHNRDMNTALDAYRQAQDKLSAEKILQDRGCCEMWGITPAALQQLDGLSGK